MTRMKLTRLAMAGAALLLCAATMGPSRAASVGPAAPQSTIGEADSSLLEVGNRHGGGGFRHGGFRNRGYGHRGFGHRYGHHHGGFRFFFAAPLYIGDDYGYDDDYRRPAGVSCYRACRDFKGPEYCRYNWRRYC